MQIRLIKQQKRVIIDRYIQADNVKGLTQVLNTLAPLAFLWWAAVASVGISYWLTALVTIPISLFTLRVLVLMHECGHGSMFSSQWLNRTFGFVFGVVAGMPQYVWSQHHDFHHANNGNWEKYRGPLTSPSVDEFAALTKAQQNMYLGVRSIAVAPLGGFVYLVFNPRFTWLKGSIQLLIHVVKSKVTQPNVALRTHVLSFETRHWNSSKEYWHMFWNNVALLVIWALLCSAIGPVLFFAIYLPSVSLAGGVGIMLFTVQHNFEHAYASASKDWDYDAGAIAGTSFLVLPGWLNWFTANIAYHHIHHLSAKIPNYRLVACHNEYRHLFESVTRVKLSQVHKALQCLIWDVRAERIISVAEFRRQVAAVRV